MKRSYSYCVKVYIRQGEAARRILYKQGLIAGNLRIRREGEYLLIPVTDVSSAIKLLKDRGVEAERCEADFEEVRRGGDELDINVNYVIIGSIAIINPRRGIEDIDYYRIQALRILERIKPVKSVYMKKGTHGKYRLPKLIHLAGTPSTITTHKEYGIRFKIDVARAFFNPRLSYEHRRVAEQVDDGERVLDMFAGVGGFSIHIASLRRASILAVDINHYAAAYAAVNVKLNRKILRGNVAVLRADASLLPQIHYPVFRRIIMNNPTMTSSFAGTACRMVHERGIIHYYTLTISTLEAQEEAQEAFSYCGAVELLETRRVLEYSPEQAVYVVDLKVSR